MYVLSEQSENECDDSKTKGNVVPQPTNIDKRTLFSSFIVVTMVSLKLQRNRKFRGQRVVLKRKLRIK